MAHFATMTDIAVELYYSTGYQISPLMPTGLKTTSKQCPGRYEKQKGITCQCSTVNVTKYGYKSEPWVNTIGCNTYPKVVKIITKQK